VKRLFDGKSAVARKFDFPGGVSRLFFYCAAVCAVVIAAGLPARAFDSKLNSRVGESDREPVITDSNKWGAFEIDPDSVKDKDAVVVSVDGVKYGAIFSLTGARDYRKWLENNSQSDVPDEDFKMAARAAKEDKHGNGDHDPIFLDKFLREDLKAAGFNYLVVPFDWTYNPKDSAQVVHLVPPARRRAAPPPGSSRPARRRGLRQQCVSVFAHIFVESAIARRHPALIVPDSRR